MTKLRKLLIPALLSLAACGDASADGHGDDSPGSPMAGNWAQDTGSAAKGITLTFDGHSERVEAHLAPRKDGTHGHQSGTYSYDAATKAVTVKCKLMGRGKADTWTGKLDGTTLELGAADITLKFQQGGNPHGK